MNDKSLSNLKPWPKGMSGNPVGRRVGSRNISTLVRKLLEQDIEDNFPLNEGLAKLLNGKDRTYVEAVVIAMTKKAIDGDVRAATWLVDQQEKGDAKDGGLFNASKLEIEIVKSPSAQILH
ncbi:hypothetical protein BH23PAT2_BH23PAT2_04190 [soil metagenome]